MKKILFFIFFLSFQCAINAQVDVQLIPNSPNLEVWIRPNGFTSNDFINGITFTIKWSTSCAGVGISSSPSSTFGPLSLSTTGSQVNGSFNYETFNGAGNSYDYSVNNGTYIKIMTVAVSGSAATCPFSIDASPPAGGNWGVDGILSNQLSSSMAGLITSANVILPVEILSFTAEKKNNSVALQFVTVKEQNLKEYVIERSGDGSIFSSIGSILPKAKNENDKVTYDFSDDTPDAGVNYYRIQSRDINGAFKYSQIVSATFGTANAVFKVFPNPATTRSSINILTSWNKEYDFKIIDFTGRLIFQQLKLHSNNVEINGLNLAAGAYSYEITTANTNVVGKLIVAE